MGRRRKRRVGLTRHPAVTLLRPTKTRPYFALRWRDEAGEQHQRSTGVQSEGIARQQAIDLSDRLNSAGAEGVDLDWAGFCQRYEEEHLSLTSDRSRSAWQTACNYYTNLMRPQFLDDVTSSAVSRFTAKLREELERRNGVCRETTVASYLRQLRAALNWAASIGLLPDKVRVLLPRRAKGRSALMRSRPLVGEELEKLILAVPRVRKRDAEQWIGIIYGFWESGLRLNELVALSWDSGDIQVTAIERIPFIRILAGGQKRHEDEFQPVTPQFWDLVKDTPMKERTGRVFPVIGRPGGQQLSAEWIGRVIGRIGRAAGIRTGIDVDKSATSHDIGRRALTVRLTPKMSEGELADFMRHKSVQTTRQYYRQPQLLELAKRVGWDVSGAQGDD